MITPMFLYLLWAVSWKLLSDAGIVDPLTDANEFAVFAAALGTSMVNLFFAWAFQENRRG